MPSAIGKKTIVFENNRSATAVFPPATATGQEIVEALEIKTHQAVLVLIGGADSVDEKLKPLLIQLFGRGIARAAASVKRRNYRRRNRGRRYGNDGPGRRRSWF